MLVAGCINVTIHMFFCKAHDRDPEAKFCSEIEAIHLHRESLLLPKTTYAQVETLVGTPRPKKSEKGSSREDD